ncbi:MAG: filamentous hemagglutinin N-terminal domain-containing protein, partial [Pegethrix bostrychoides GSE-TBD4-15B]|nr:filamentous hemagglutinin N-terminal domain-containing protein [Pegethrix bostrychoides GSE-TBD4-15B]
MRKVLWATLVGLSAIGVIGADAAVAQVVPDVTLGAESSRVRRATVRGRDADLIEGGAARGRNLFHSFQEFGVRDGDAAYFANPAATENIFSRVTGSNPSNILGTLGVDGTANLFFMNPNGILFGPNASLDVGGSFAATTANAIQFGEQGFFNATNPEAPALLTINPSAFLFNQIPIANPATITNQANTIFGLRVGNGQNLLLLGGNVENDGGRLSAFEGRVEVGSVAGIGTIELNTDDSLSFPATLARGDVSFTNGSRVAVAFSEDGDIGVTAQNIEVLDNSLLAAGIFINSGAVGNQAGNLTLNATGDIRVRDSSITNNVNLGATGNGGNLIIAARSLSVEEGAQLVASTRGQGDAGNVIINAQDRVSFVGRSADGKSSSAAFSTVEATGVGQGGNVEITTGSLDVQDGAQLVANTRGQGDAGNVIINAQDRVSFVG